MIFFYVVHAFNLLEFRILHCICLIVRFCIWASMTSQYYRGHLLDQLHNLHESHMSVQDYIIILRIVMT